MVEAPKFPSFPYTAAAISAFIVVFVGSIAVNFVAAHLASHDMEKSAEQASYELNYQLNKFHKAFDVLLSATNGAKPPQAHNLLSSAKRSHGFVKQIRRFDAGGKILLTSDGDVGPSRPLAPGPHPDCGARWSASNGVPAFTACRQDGSGLQAILSPEKLLSPAIFSKSDGRGGLALRGADGTILAQTADFKPIGNHESVNGEAQLAETPLVIEAVSEPGYKDRVLWNRVIPIAAPILPILAVLATLPMVFRFLNHLRQTHIDLIGLIEIIRLEKEMPKRVMEALSNDELKVHYQPIIDLNAGKCVGAEALLRWFPPSAAPVPPDEFIPKIENSDLIFPLTDWVLETVNRELAPLYRGNPDLRVSVNLVARHFGDANIHNTIAKIFDGGGQGAGINASQLVLEWTERQVLDDENQNAARVLMQGLQGMGVRIAIDDFGQGAKAFANLQGFPVDYVKIDKEFVDVIPSPGGAKANPPLIDGMIKMLKMQGKLIVAEGVETEFQKDYLEGGDRKVEYAQGYYFARPMSVLEYYAFVYNFN